MNTQVIGRRSTLPSYFCLRWTAGLLVLGATALAQQPGTELAAFKNGAAARSRAADAAGVYNDFIAAQVGGNGRFNFGAFPDGGAALDGSQSFNLSFAWPSSPGTSYTTVRVNGADLVFGQSELPLVSGPTNAGDVSTCVAENSQVRVLQELSIVNGPNSGRADTIRIRYQVTNLTNVSQQVGLRIMIDTMLANNDAAPFRIPGVGAVTTERMFTGTAVPSFWQAFQSLENATTASQGTLITNDAVTPTRFAVANWGRLQSSPYDFTADETQSTGDSGIGIWWDNLSLAPQQTAEVATFYGLGDQSVAQGSVSLGVSGPAEVSLGQPQFQIAATVENASSEVRSDVIVDLTLPAGFSEAVPSRIERSLGDLQPGQSAAVLFNVDASGVSPGSYTYTVKAGPRADAVLVQVSRQIEVTAAPTGLVSPAASFFFLAPGSPVDTTTGQSPLNTELSLIAQLNDANGQPVSGVAPERVTYTVTPANGAELTQRAQPSDADGAIIAILIGLLRGTVTITAAFDGTTFGAPIVLDFDDIRAATALFELSPGLHLLSQPVRESIPVVARRGRGLVSPVYYDADARQYRAAEGVSGRPGLGFFLRNSATLELQIDGFLPWSLSPQTPGDLLLQTFGADESPATPSRAPRQNAAGVGSLSLTGSWNLLGNPFGFPIEWHLAQWQVVVNGAVLGTLADPATWSYVDPYAFVYGRQGYELIFDQAVNGFEQVSNQIGVLRGFWMRRAVSPDTIELRYLPEPAGVARSSSGAGWAVTLTASSDGAQASVTCGAQAALGRQLSISRPPAIDEPGVDIAVVDGTTRLAGQVLGRAGTYQYTVEVKGRAGRDVALTWSGLGRDLPAGYDAVLTDLQSGRRLSMRARSLYVYASQGETRRFVVEITHQSGAPLAVQIQAAPTRARGAGVTLILNRPAEVHLVVQSLSGRLVREVTTQAAGAGATTLSWDGLDQTGRRVPAGLYQVLAVAESDAGEVARAVTTVNVP